MDRRHRLAALFLLAALGFVAVAVAQVPSFTYRGSGIVVGEGPKDRSAFTVCRLAYTQVRREQSGSGWDTELPIADQNLMIRLADFTNLRILRFDNGDPAQVVIRAFDDGLFQCPFLIAADAGTAGFNETEVERLREYLLKGGFLWADDLWGDRALDHWFAQMRAVLPEHDPFELAPDHPLFSAFYFIDKVPQIPNIQFWRGSGGQTSERGISTAKPALYGIADSDGRLLVVVSHNTDIADGWEREGEEFEYFHAFSAHAYALATNVVVSAMTR